MWDADGVERAYDPDRLIVRLWPGLGDAAVADLTSEAGATRVGGLPALGIEYWDVSGADVESLVKELSADDRVAYAESDWIVSIADVRAEATPGDPRYLDGTLWGLHNTGQSGGLPDADIDAPEAWDLSTGSASVIVGVIDSGVDYRHPDLAGNMWVNPGEVAGNGIDDDGNGFVDDIHGWDFANDDADPFDDEGHGTHVAGTIGAVGSNGVGVVGVAWDVSIMALKFLNASGSGSTSDAISAIQYATQMGAHVTNNSWGGGGFSQALRDAIAAAGAAGSLFVAAAGNDGSNTDSSPSYPAAYPLNNIVSVASSTRLDARSSFSNFGATSVDLAAPGSSIFSTLPNGGYGSLSGTSMASPHVAGVAALLKSVDPTLTPAQTRQVLMDSVDVLPGWAGLTVTGGRLNAHSALLLAGAGGNQVRGDVFLDRDADGVRDADELGQPGVTVFLDANLNATPDAGEPAATTGADGRFAIVGVPAGPHVVRQVVPGNHGQSTPVGNAGVNVTVVEGANIEGVRFGNAPDPVSLAGLAFRDLNGDGDRDAGEGPLPGVTVYLDLDADQTPDANEPAAVTDAAGAYRFDQLPPDAYTVRSVAPAGFELTGPVAGSDDYAALDRPYRFVDISTTGTAVLASSDDAAATIPLGFGFDFYGQTYTSVFASSNGLMTFGTSNSAYANASLTTGSPAQAAIAPFWDDLMTDGAADAVYYQTRSVDGRTALVVQWNDLRFFNVSNAGLTFQAILFADGTVEFNYENLSVGVAGRDEGASATVGIKPANGAAGTPLQLTFNSTANVLVGTGESVVLRPSADFRYDVTLTPGQSVAGLDFALEPVGPVITGVAGNLWYDWNADGLRGAEPGHAGRTVFADLNGSGTLDAGEPSTTSNVNGDYVLVGLPAGLRRIRAVLPHSGWQVTTTPVQAVSVLAGQTVPDVNFGSRLPGDADLDGAVTLLGDFSAALRNLNAVGVFNWLDGDMDGDGVISIFGDLSVILAGLPPAGDAAAAVSLTPDPPPARPDPRVARRASVAAAARPEPWFERDRDDDRLRLERRLR